MYVCEKKSHFRKKTFSCVIRLMLTTVQHCLAENRHIEKMVYGSQKLFNL